MRVLFARVICSFRVLLDHLDDPVPSLPDGHEDASGQAPLARVAGWAGTLSVGTKVRVESPPELDLAVREKALEIARGYDREL